MKNCVFVQLIQTNIKRRLSMGMDVFYNPDVQVSCEGLVTSAFGVVVVVGCSVPPISNQAASQTQFPMTSFDDLQ